MSLLVGRSHFQISTVSAFLDCHRASVDHGTSYIFWKLCVHTCVCVCVCVKKYGFWKYGFGKYGVGKYGVRKYGFGRGGRGVKKLHSWNGNSTKNLLKLFGPKLFRPEPYESSKICFFLIKTMFWSRFNLWKWTYVRFLVKVSKIQDPYFLQ